MELISQINLLDNKEKIGREEIYSVSQEVIII